MGTTESFFQFDMFVMLLSLYFANIKGLSSSTSSQDDMILVTCNAGHVYTITSQKSVSFKFFSIDHSIE